MKKKIFSLALVAAFVGSMAMGCSSTKKAGNADSTNADSNKMKAPMDTPSNGGVDTAKAKVDTSKKDTLKKP
jgi:hypothetical protein